MTGDELRSLSAAATPGPWTADDLEVWGNGEAVAIGLMPEDAVLIEWLRNHADALVDLIDATRSYLADPAGRMDAALAALDALDALDQEAPA